MIKLVVVDLDCTLLRTDKTASIGTAEVLARCRARGIKVAFATARPIRTTNEVVGTIEFDARIFHNGANVYAGEELLFKCGIDIEVAQAMLLELNRDFPERLISVEIDDVNYSNQNVMTEWARSRFVVTDFTDLPRRTADKVLVEWLRDDDLAVFEGYIADELYVENSEGKIALIMNKNATKLRAVALIAEHFGIELSEVVAFGDDVNDIEMLRNCGCGVAMANALDEVKAVADEICGSNDEDGVAEWLRRKVLAEL